MKEWLVDRSRYETGKSCEVRRFFEYHAFGTGIKSVGKSPYLLTGTAVHEAIQKIILKTATPEVAALEARDWYVKEMEGKEFYIPTMLEEQIWLAQVLVLGWAKKVLPYLSGSEILCVEQEETYEIQVPWGTIVLMSRPDLIIKQNGEVLVLDLKTAKSANDKWFRDWTDSMQMMVGPVGAQKRLGVPIEKYIIHGLVKTVSKPSADLWTVHTDKHGMTQHFWSAGAKKTPAYEAGMTPFQYIEWLDELGVLSGHFVIAGPYRVKHDRVEQFFRGLVGEETRWKNALDAQPQAEWETKTYQDWIDSTFPRPSSSVCAGSYGEPRCPFYDLCYKQSGWKWPLDNSFEQRVPHHQLELERQKEQTHE